jgi:SAM-dependent methyltransferase
MALERIDPFQREDRFCVDHLLRYAWLQPLVDKQRVLDVACGHGFGCAMLSEANASAVVGVDLDEATIGQCRERWKNPRVEFRTGRIEALAGMGMEPFDRVVCFETLEHLESPETALEALRSVMSEGGLLVGSVPGEPDVMEENEFHLQFFNAGRLRALLGKTFRNVRLFRQCYHLGSLIEPVEAAREDVLERREIPSLKLDFGRAEDWADTYVFIASDAELPEMTGVPMAFSRQAWLAQAGDYLRASNELDRLSARFRELFFRHGDLKRRFANTLGWGKYYHRMATGEEPEAHYLKKIEEATSEQEQDLREELERLKKENDELRQQVRADETILQEESARRRERFMQILKGAPGESK